MITKDQVYFTLKTLKFAPVGFVIPGITAIIILGLQMSIEGLGIECSKSWTILWKLTLIGSIIAPLIFTRSLGRKIQRKHNLSSQEITFFNIIEYILLQSTLAMFFSKGETLCYVTDGQNGFEFIFTGWFAIPFLIIISFAFDLFREKKTGELED